MVQLVKKVSQFINTNGLPTNESRMLVTVSGGADSVALLRILLMLRYECHVVHCNFHLRGEESNRDELFVKNLCEQLSIPCDVISLDTKEYARKNALSIEMAAREQRYEAFEKLRIEKGCDYIAVAHHMEDSAETILLNLIRGTGITGLTGIAPLMGKIVRPLLGVKRQEIEDFLRSISQPYVTDSTNESDEFARNKVRNRIIPAMEEINPAAVDNIIRTAHHLQGTQDLLDNRSSEEASITILHGFLHPYGYNETQVSNLITALKRNQQTLIPSGNGSSGTTLVVSRKQFDKETMPRAKNTFCLDIRKVMFPISIRTWKQGDKIYPFGMNGKSKLVSDILTDAKLSRQERERQQVLCVGNEIAWIVNIRSDERFRVHDDATEIIVFETIKQQ